MLDLNRLRVLAAVTRIGTVTGAAHELHYSQPSVSHHLARLETETGAQLVQRVGRGIRLTEAGRVLAERAVEILGRLDSASAELDTYIALGAGRIRVAAQASVDLHRDTDWVGGCERTRSPGARGTSTSQRTATRPTRRRSGPSAKHWLRWWHGPDYRARGGQRVAQEQPVDPKRKQMTRV